MYDADYANYLEAQEEAEALGFVTKNSGTKAHHSDGVVRDTDKGKPRFDLMFPKGVPFSEQLITRVAELYERGGQSYGYRNWENSSTEETLEHHEAALMRHVIRFLTGEEDGEDHAAAVVWNVNAVDLCRRKLALKALKSTIEAANKVLLPAAEETEPEWDDEDELEEDQGIAPLFGRSPYVWIYCADSGTWLYKTPNGKPYPESARSFKKLLEDFGPLKCTKGKHEGEVFDGEGKGVLWHLTMRRNVWTWQKNGC
jgi:hypothetical protein